MPISPEVEPPQKQYLAPVKDSPGVWQLVVFKPDGTPEQLKTVTSSDAAEMLGFDDF